MILSVSLTKPGSDITEPLDKLSNSFQDKLIAALSPILTDAALLP